MHYGMKEKNPLDFVKFYSKRSSNGMRSVFVSLSLKLFVILIER